jgi:RecB family endonuclease NucS
MALSAHAVCDSCFLMTVEFGIWRIDDDETTPVAASALANEAKLEAILERDPSILGLDVLLIVGRQVITSLGTRIDLLAIDSEGSLYVIEVKKGRTPREVVAQALDFPASHLRRFRRSTRTDMMVNLSSTPSASASTTNHRNLCPASTSSS